MPGNFVLADDFAKEASSFQSDPLPLDEGESTTVTWPLLSGESVQSLSRLFYPNNKRMQHLFVQRTLHLSQEIRPNLNAYTTINQASLVIIPNIKYLARQGSRTRHTSTNKVKHNKLKAQQELKMSDALKDADKFSLTPEMQSKYEGLVKKNELLKNELEKLNSKLVSMQEAMAALNIEAKRMQNPPALSPAEINMTKPAGSNATAISKPFVPGSTSNVPEQPNSKLIKKKTTLPPPAVPVAKAF